jgi:DnaJ-class molecular chaperone
MENYYHILGVSSAATPDELRRAYRILARRYHPDVNPGKSSEERFKRIAEAYAVLQDSSKRRAFDLELEREHAEGFTAHFDKAHQAYRKQQSFEEAYSRAEAQTRKRYSKAKSDDSTRNFRQKPPPAREGSNQPPHQENEVESTGAKITGNFRRFVDRSHEILDSIKERLPPLGKWRASTSVTKEQPSENKGTSVTQISILEVSVSVIDAIRGLKKTVELNDGTSLKKISVTIPAGVRSGSVIRFRRRENTSEEIVIIIRVAAHPFLSIAPKGLIIEVPITVKEAVLGARIKVPTLDEPSTVFIEPGTQSGTEVRLRGQGIQYRDGAKGDLFVRVMVRVPATHGAVGLAEKCGELEMYYEKSVREALPHSILEM